MKKTVIFGVDVGGTQIKFGIFDGKGKLLNDWAISTNREDCGAHIIESVVLSIESVIAKIGLKPEQIEGIGMGVPGPVTENGLVLEAANLGWYHRDVKKELEELSGYRAEVGNDANLAALGEQWAGSAKGKQNVVMITIGTGVGGGIIQSGKLLYGVKGAAGELGHICVDSKETARCNCGKRGCLEQYASGRGMGVMAEKYGMGPLSPEEIWNRVKRGDEKARMVAEVFGEKMGLALANAATTLNPEVFIIGGGVSKAGPVLLEYIQKYYHEYVFTPCKNAAFTLASLGNQGGIYGAARMVLGEEQKQ